MAWDVSERLLSLEVRSSLFVSVFWGVEQIFEVTMYETEASVPYQITDRLFDIQMKALCMCPNQHRQLYVRQLRHDALMPRPMA